MGAFSTRTITRKQAEDMILAIKRKEERPLANWTIKDLDKKINEYAYSREHEDILGCLYNFIVLENEDN